MSRIILALVSLLSIVSTSRGTEQPWFCQDYDCPAFTSQDEGGFEIRNYEETTWVVTSATSDYADSNGATNDMFGKLFDYITGDNDRGENIDMTVPVLTKVEKRESDYLITMMFYLTSNSPPAPTNPEVSIVTRPAGEVFVRSFPGRWWPSKAKYRRELSIMKRSMDNKVSYNADVYFKAGYNSPYEFFKRKQFELWMLPQ